MPSFADLKAKASGVTNAGVEKFQNVKDRNTSVSLKKTNWDPYSGTPPPPPPPPRTNIRTKPSQPPPLLPPPPSRTSSVSRSSTPLSTTSESPVPPPLPRRSPQFTPPLPQRAPSATPPTLPSRAGSAHGTPVPGPPPVNRSTLPNLSSRQMKPSPSWKKPVSQEPEIDWTNLSAKDKEVFFSWLDEFFSRFFNITIPPRGDSGKSITQAPPPARTSSKPWVRNTVDINVPATNSSDFTLSHPPASEHGSLALDVAHFFAPSTRWTEPWFASDQSLPPPLIGNTAISYKCAWKTYGPEKSVYIGVMFSDLSIFWGSVEFNTNNVVDPNRVKRDATYLPRPSALNKEQLVQAYETYGDTIASFAESFLGTGEYCARGECWDLANEALKYFADYDYVPKPIPSINRTHGHLIYEGKASKKGKETIGRWRGGDDMVRRGDIVEWRRVRIGIPNGHFTLGEPDHTAVIVQDLLPATRVNDQTMLTPAQLGTLVVVEQSVGQPPERREYDLSGLEEGEMWIYRPIGMQEYLGIEDLTAMVPEDNNLLLHI